MHKFGSLLMCLILLSQCILIKTHAQNNNFNYSFLHYNSDNSILQNGTWAVEFDRQGYCWIGTENGLVRFDGKNFKVFDKKNIPALHSSTFTSIIADKKNIFYAKDDFGGRIKINAGNARGSYALADSNSFLIGRKGWLYKESDYKRLLTRFCDSNKIKALEDNRQFIGINDSTIYFYDVTNLWYVYGNTVKLIRMRNPMDNTDGVVLNISLVGDMLVSVHKSNAVECFYKGKTIKTITHINGAIAQDTGFLNGDFRVLWCRSGSYIYTNGKLYNIFLKDDSLQSTLLFTDLPASSMVALYYNSQTNLYFLLTNNDGIFIIKKNRFNVVTAPGDNRYNNSYYTISEMPGNSVAANNFLFDSAGNAGKFFLADSRLRLMYNNAGKGMWYSYRDSLKYFAFDLKKNTVEQKFKQIVNTYCVNPFDSALYFTSGFTIFKLSKNKIQYVLYEDSVFKTPAENIPHNKITCIGMYAPGKFVLGTYNGLYAFDMQTKKISSVAQGIQAHKIYCDVQGNTWICAFEGFYCFNKNGLTFFQPDYRKNFSSFYEILEDDQGYLWISTNAGIIAVKKQNLLAYSRNKNVYIQYNFFDKSDGFATNEFNGGGTNCALKFSGGKMVFSSQKGLVYFHPRNLTAYNSHTIVYIDNIVIDSVQAVSFQNFSVPASFSKLSFSVSAPGFINTSDNDIEYSVKNLNNSWEPLPDDGIIAFNRLPHGSYTLQLRKGNGLNGYVYTKSLFIVKAYFYQTWWFKILTGIILFLAVYILIRLRLRLLYQQKRKLENTVLIRTGELNQNIAMLKNTIEELETSEEKIYQNSKFKEKIISIVLHDLRSPLRFLSSISNHLATGYKNMEPDNVKENLDSLSAESTSIYNFTNEFLTWIYTQQSDYVLNKKLIGLDALFANIQNLYQKIAEQNNNTIQIKYKEATCITDESILKIIIRNLVDNAAKHTRNTTIILSAFRRENNIIISVSDNGQGIPETFMQALNDNINAKNESEKTLGLLLIQELVKKLDGTVQFKQNIPSGTISEVTLSDNL